MPSTMGAGMYASSLRVAIRIYRLGEQTGCRSPGPDHRHRPAADAAEFSCGRHGDHHLHAEAGKPSSRPAPCIFGARGHCPRNGGDASANPRIAEATTLTFVIPAVAAADYMVRLRVEGVDSLPVAMSGSPLQLGFDSSQRVTVQ